MSGLQRLLEDPAVLWYLNRATGFVVLVSLTACTVLGIVGMRPSTPGGTRLAVQLLHRRLAALSLALLVAHIVPAVVDGYVDLGWLDGLVPFLAGYQTLWTALGTLALDVLVFVALTAWLRPPWWRGAHLAAYAAWPLAVAHSVGEGTDTRHGLGLAAVVLCSAAVLAATCWRLARLRRERRTRQVEASR